MKRYDDSHRDPKPHTPAQSPLQNKDETKYSNAVQYWQGKIKSSQTIEQPSAKRRANNSHNTPHHGKRIFLAALMSSLMS